MQCMINGALYEGYFKSDAPNGRGRMIVPEGELYEGNFINGKA